MSETIQDRNGDTWKLIDSWTSAGIPEGTGKSTALCPECSAGRKPHNQKQKCLSVNYDRGTAKCNNEGCRFMIKTGTAAKEQARTEQPKKQYKKPDVKIKSDIPDNLLSWLYDRKISQAVIERNKIGHSVQWFAKAKVNAPCISFPYHKDGILTGIKYRLPDPKDWAAEPGAEPILYGYDDIKGDTLIWVEGELDKLAVEVAGFQNCVSVPNGAKSAGSLENVKDKIKDVKTHIIAVDGDGSGKELQEDLIRRLNPGKCKIVKWIDGLKDANEVLKEFDQYAVKHCIEDAERVPIKGIVKPIELLDKMLYTYDNGVDPGLSTGWSNLDKLYRVKPGQWTVVTGIPNHGKSEFLDALMVNMIMLHGWKFGIFSPENYPLDSHMRKIVRKAVSKPFEKDYNGAMSRDEVKEAIINLNDRINFVGCDEETHTMESLLELAVSLVLSQGINGLIIDPWNTIEHNRPASMSETEYISSALSKVVYTTRRHNIHIWLVAHPTKLQKLASGGYAAPLPYDISGSAHWYNKADNALTVHVGTDKDRPANEVQIHVNKIKFRENGQPGRTELYYHLPSGRYAETPNFRGMA
jgi:twinkle protein